MGSLSPGGHKVCFSPLRVFGGHGFDSKCNFTPLTLLLGQHLAATTPALHCKRQYCIGICEDRSKNQGDLEVVKQETVSVSTDILGIRELKCTGKGEFNSDDHYIYYHGQESLRKNGVAIIVNKKVQNAVPTTRE